MPVPIKQLRHSVSRFFLTLLLVSQAWSYSIVTNNGQPVSLDPGSFTMQIRLGSASVLSDSSTYNSSVQTAMQVWNAQLGNVQLANQIGSAAAPVSNNNINEIGFDSTVYGTDFDANVLAVTVSYYFVTPRGDGSYRRSQSDIIFNTAYTWDSYRGALRMPEDIRRVALHELGHVLGLDHPDQATPPQSVTALMNSLVSNLDTLAADDIAGAQSLYGSPNAAPSITSQPANQAVYAGQNAQFSISASGTPAPTFRWQRLPAGSGTWANLTDGGSYTGTGTATLAVTGTSVAMSADQFRCVATNGNGSATSTPATLTVNATTVPSITTQPSSQTVLEGGSVTFSAAATGVPSPTFQWRKGGVNIAGATGSTYSIASAALDDAGNYTLIATNFVGSATSNVAALSVAVHPTFTLRPASQRVIEGESVSFMAAASGGGSITYQWKHNRQIIAGNASASLNFGSVSLADRGYYEVVATNAAGGYASSVFYLSVAVASPTVAVWGDISRNPPVLTGSIADVQIGGAVVALMGDGTVVAWGGNSSGQATVPADLASVVAVAAGGGHTLALKSDGTILGWGDNSSAQTTSPSGLNGVVAIAAGPSHSLALKSDGTLVGWGSSAYGQSVVPVGLQGVVAIKTGRFHSIALRSDGSVVQWGDSSGSAVPVGLTDAIAIASGETHALALKSDRTVVAWGSDYVGSTVVPTGLAGVAAIAAGASHSLALKSDGTVVGWGRDYEHQATPPAGLSGVVTIDAEGWESLALLRTVSPTITTNPVNQTAVAGDYVSFTVASTGTIPITYQWRKGGVNLSEGDGIAGSKTATLVIAEAQIASAGSYDVLVSNSAGSAISNPVVLLVKEPPSFLQRPLSRIVTIGQSVTFSAAATGQGPLTYQWKHNGTAIDGATTSTLTLPLVGVAHRGFYEVIATNENASNHSHFLLSVVSMNTENLTVFPWGSSGYGSSGPSNIPVNLQHIVAVAAGTNHAVALKADGTIQAWGVNNFGPTSIPSGLTGVVGIAAGEYHTLALRANGTVLSWGGYNGSPSPVPAGLRGVVAISAKGSTNVALKSDGTVVAWGIIPAPSGLSNVVSVAAGNGHALALRSDGTVVSWGGNSNGQTNVPPSLSGVIEIGAGHDHSLALKNDGTVVGWGRSDVGQSTVPANMGNGIAITGGFVHSIALKSDGSVLGWGRDNEGESSPPAGLVNVAAITAGSYYNLVLAPLVKANITSQPIGQTISTGQSATFTVVGTGTRIVYQWRRNGVNLTTGGDIFGADGPTLTISNAQAGDSGNYDVVVSNPAASVISNPATLTVNIAPLFTQRPRSRLVQVGQPVTFAAVTNDTGSNTYQWKHNGRLIPGVTGPTLALSSVSFADRGYYLVTTSNGSGAASSVFYLNVSGAGFNFTNAMSWTFSDGSTMLTQLTDSPVSIADIVAGRDATFILKEDGNIEAWGLVPGYLSAATGVVSLSAKDRNVIALKSNGTVTSMTAALEPATQALSNVVQVAAGADTSYALRADGTVVSWHRETEVSYQVVPGLTGIVNISAGEYHLLALREDGTVVGYGANSWGESKVPSDLSNVSAIAAASGFSIALKNDGTVVAWGNAESGRTAIPAGLNNVTTISAGFAHGLALKADGSLVAWGSTYNSITPAVPSVLNGRVLTMAAGSYHDVAIVAVLSPPAIVTHPESQAGVMGMAVSFSVGVSGIPAPAYQWRKDGVNIAGATGGSYTIGSVDAGDAGSYTVVVTNTEGSIMSAAAVLSVVTTNGNAVAYGSTNFPSGAAAGTVINFSYTVTNTGTKAWGANHYLALQRGDGSLVQMGSLSGTGVDGSKTVIFSLPTPASAGTYQYRVQPLENGVEWFGSSMPLTLTVTPAMVSAQGNAVAYGAHSFPLSASAGSVVNFTYTVTNAGTKAWGTNHYLALMQSDYTVVQLGSLSATAAGGSKTVSLNLPVPATPGTYHYRVQPLENGVEWFGSPLTLTLIVTPVVVTAQGNALAYGLNTFPLSASAGSVVDFNYNVSNLGTKVWGPNHYLALLDAGFNLIEFADLNGVAIGGSTTARLSFPVPGTPGTYHYIVRPLENGVEWFGTQLSMSLIVTPVVVTAQGNALGYGTTTFPVTVNAGATVNFTYNTTNLGTRTWGANHYLALLDPSYNLVDFGDLATTTAGGSKAASVSFTAPVTPGTYHYILRPLENGLEWFGTEVHLTLTVL